MNRMLRTLRSYYYRLDRIFLKGKIVIQENLSYINFRIEFPRWKFRNDSNFEKLTFQKFIINYRETTDR